MLALILNYQLLKDEINPGFQDENKCSINKDISKEFNNTF